MNLKFIIFDALCDMREFKINGVDANKEDFGTQDDKSPETAEDYCCEDMRFMRQVSAPEVLDKYGITKLEYDEICKKLEDGLSFGCCGLCS